MGVVVPPHLRRKQDELAKLRAEITEIRRQIRDRNLRYLEICKRIGELKKAIGDES